ncbi:TonB-dependent receptor [Hymenobacter sp. HSC-4F20]|uniref:TonB-dependent receptor n=1 Tax=Hymenobacter sp. HSC-4F20 TaxID=2864135 RepID=UPI001C732B83|nr:TonB-dependent receptor [Hymenobacter sp. HSC-4F20]MBX0291269.1 TonB-dependent receptor [Hymenobacter sp. HSC-4F20]
MKNDIKSWLLLGLLVLLHHLVSAQVTSSALNGKVASDTGEDLIGVTVVATHLPTGTKRGTATEADGRFTIPNLQAGGPYTVQVSYIGFTTQTQGNIFLTLGNTTRLNFTLAPEATALQEVVVTGSNEATKTGAGTSVGREQLRTLPTISRSIQDFTRLDPRNSNNSFAGSNFRYNNVTLDGAINNDAIGFSPSSGGVPGTSGVPGGSARANPISLDAIQEIQAQVAPFDVKLGNFTGGSVNAVTRSGTNEVTGSLYAFGRNQAITGRSIDESRTRLGSSYHDYQTGFRVGLPILKNKLFFFTNAEIARRQEPVFYGAGQQGSVVSQELAQAITANLQQKYGYDVGAFGNYTIHANSDKIFGRLDWNLNDKTSVVLRHNYIKANATNLERSLNQFKFGSQDFDQNNLQNSTVMEVKSNFSSALSNSLVLGYTNIHDYRSLLNGAQVFPAIQINNVGTGANFTGSGIALLGADREASIYNMRQKTFEITDNVTFYQGAHAITLGTHNELYKIDYGFINSWNGRIEYRNVSDFLADRPQRIRGTYNVQDNSYQYNYNNPSASFRINLYSAYLQDEFTVNDRLKITPGLRLDLADVPTKPTLSPKVTSTPEYVSSTGATYEHTKFSDFNNQFLGQVQVSPRLGFNFDAKGDGSVVLRGGSGVFTGRVPFAWFGYAFYNNGVNYNSVDYNNIQTTASITNKTYTLNSDPTKIYQQLPASAQNTTEINLIDKDFKMPQVWRSSLALDYLLPGGVKATVEALYTKTLYDVKFQNINLKDSTRYLGGGPTESPYYLSGGRTGGKVNPQFSNLFLLTNTRQGYRYQLTGQLSKSFKQGLDVSGAYTYGQSKDISNGIRNSFQSNWELNPALNVNDPGLAYSNFDLRHRVVSTVGYHRSWAQRFTSYVSLVLTYQSGSPYTYVYNNNFLGNGQQNVQLLYVPGSATDVVFVDPASVAGSGALRPDASGQQYAALQSYISQDDYLRTRRGQYAERNAARTPWNNNADLRLMQEIRLGGLTDAASGAVTSHPHTIQISLDVINVGNLLSRDWGRKYFVPDTFNSTSGIGLTQTGWADASGNLSRSNSVVFNRPAFTYTTPTTKPYSIDQLASRWQGQLGVRYSF